MVAKPLDVTHRHVVTFEIVWHVNTQPVTVDAFIERIHAALADRP